MAFVLLILVIAATLSVLTLCFKEKRRYRQLQILLGYNYKQLVFERNKLVNAFRHIQTCNSVYSNDCDIYRMLVNEKINETLEELRWETNCEKI